jgi:CheY-like chemotaxis protein
MTQGTEPAFVYLEDDLFSRQVVQVLLTRVLKYSHLLLLESSDDLFSRLAEFGHRPTVFFLDIQIRPYDGYQVLAMLRGEARFAQSIMIAMTANVMSHDVEKLKNSGFDGLIGKPIMREQFPQLVERILRGESVWYIP